MISVSGFNIIDKCMVIGIQHYNQRERERERERERIIGIQHYAATTDLTVTRLAATPQTFAIFFFTLSCAFARLGENIFIRL